MHKKGKGKISKQSDNLQKNSIHRKTEADVGNEPNKHEGEILRLQGRATAI